MMPVCEIETDRIPGIERVETATRLSAFQRPDCAAAVWERPAPGFLPWIEAMDPARLPEARLTLRVENARDAVTEICDACGTPEGAERAAFIDDVVNLTRAFAGLMETEFLRLRFDIVTGNACRKFHVDAVAARLVCTYRGTATQYSVPGEGGEARQVFTTPTGSPILLRGTLWPPVPDCGLLHRSPPIEGSGQTRLLLVLDPAKGLETA